MPLEEAMAIANDWFIDEGVDLEALVDWPEIDGCKCTRLMRSDGKALVAETDTELIAELIKQWMVSSSA